VALNGNIMPPIEIIAQLNEQAGSFGIGRYSGLEHLEQGEKVLEVREAPAATLLMDAYRHLETAAIDYEVLREKFHQEQLWVREAIEGRWFSRLRESADQFIHATAQYVSGTVRYKLRQGAADLCAIQAKAPRYLKDRDTWEKEVAKERSRTTLEAPKVLSQRIMEAV
jgi:argininosuccinate synthase